MNIDRKAFLVFASLIASVPAVACSAEADGSSASQDLTSDHGSNVEGAGACYNDDETAYPYQEGTCVKLYMRALEDDYAHWTAPQEGGGTLASKQGCEPISPNHPGGEVTGTPCDMPAGSFVYSRCVGFSEQLKKSAAAEAIKCLDTSVPNFRENMSAVTECGFAALANSCPFHPTAESTCAQLAPVLTSTEKAQCDLYLSGLREEARTDIVELSKTDHWYNLHSAIEGILREKNGVLR